MGLQSTLHNERPMNESEIFEAALKKSAGPERDAFIDEACGDDSVLRARVASLIEAHQDPESFLDNPAEAALAGLGETVITELERDGQQVGPYKLLQQIGEGGMGVVFMAEQTEPVRRRVALKIIKPGMDTREVIARFEAERQALAIMDHPNIAKVLDAGTTAQGRPYFVMELVHGLPLTEYCDEHNLSTPQRLNLFASVCRGVQHAHQKGVIHRDLKPGNILVAEYDHEAVPKVIDFGVAKATNQQLTEKTLFTQFGQIVGTLDYMSPEQAKRNQLDVDTRSDVYSLGIVLYELLTGQTPFDKQRLRSAAFDEMLRIIREEEPKLPSMKLSESKELASVAAHHGVDPGRLMSLVKGDLDWIVLKALQKDRAHRYPTAQELHDDVRRHLEDRTVLAGPPRLITRARKFVRRNLVPLLITSGVVTALLVASLVYFQARRAERDQIARRSSRVSTALEEASMSLGQAMKSPINSSTEWATADVSLEHLRAAIAAGEIDADLADRADALLRTAEDARAERSIAEQLENILITSASHPDLQSWVRMEQRLRQLFEDNGLDLSSDDPMVIARKIKEHKFQYQFSDILELWIGTRAQISALGGEAATAANMQPWAEAMYACDDDVLRTGIRRIMYSGRPPQPAQVNALVEKADLRTARPRTLAWLAHVYAGAQAIDESDRIFRLVLDRYPANVMLNFDYGFALATQKRWHEASRMYARALAIRPDASGLWQMYGIALENVDEPENAARAFARSCDLEPDYGPSWVNYGNALLKLNRSTEAAEAAQNAIRTMPEHPAGHGVLGRALMQQKKYPDALTALEECERLAKTRPRWTEPVDEWLTECRKSIAP